VFELPGVGGCTPICLLNPPKQDSLGYPRGVSFNPPPLLMMLNRPCVMIMTMNRQMSTPHLFFDNSNPGHNYSTKVAEQPTNASIWTPQNGSLGSTILILDSTFWLDSTLRIRPDSLITGLLTPWRVLLAALLCSCSHVRPSFCCILLSSIYFYLHAFKLVLWGRIRHRFLRGPFRKPPT
jgi:hypothetical protein